VSQPTPPCTAQEPTTASTQDNTYAATDSIRANRVLGAARPTLSILLSTWQPPPGNRCTHTCPHTGVGTEALARAATMACSTATCTGKNRELNTMLSSGRQLPGDTSLAVPLNPGMYTSPSRRMVYRTLLLGSRTWGDANTTPARTCTRCLA
jgi:hypothetical protein